MSVSELAQLGGGGANGTIRDTPSLALASPKAYPIAMTDDPNKSQSPWKLNSGRVVLLVMGTLLLAIIASTLLGGLGNYQQLKEGAKSPPVQSEPAATP